MTAKTYQDTQAELRVLLNKLYSAMDDASPLREWLIAELTILVLKKEIELQRESEEEVRESLNELITNAPEYKFYQHVTESLQNHSNWIIRNIFDDKSGFKQTVFPEKDSEGRNRDEQAVKWTEDRTKNAEVVLTGFMENKGEFEKILTQIGDKYGKEEALILISTAFDSALTCQQSDLVTMKEDILKNKDKMTQEEIYKKFAEITTQLDKNVQADLTQELEYTLVHDVTVKKAGENLRKSDKWNQLISEAACIEYTVDGNGNSICLKPEEAEKLLCFIVDGRMVCTAPKGQDATLENKLEYAASMLGDVNFVADAIRSELSNINCSEKKNAYLFSAGLRNVDFKFKNVSVKTAEPSLNENIILSDFQENDLSSDTITPLSQSVKTIPVTSQMVTRKTAPQNLNNAQPYPIPKDLPEKNQYGFLVKAVTDMAADGSFAGNEDLIKTLAKNLEAAGVQLTKHNGVLTEVRVYEQPNNKKIEGHSKNISLNK